MRLLFSNTKLSQLRPNFVLPLRLQSLEDNDVQIDQSGKGVKTELKV